jgi:hypothetical protein
MNIIESCFSSFYHRMYHKQHYQLFVKQQNLTNVLEYLCQVNHYSSSSSILVHDRLDRIHWIGQERLTVTLSIARHTNSSKKMMPAYQSLLCMHHLRRRKRDKSCMYLDMLFSHLMTIIRHLIGVLPYSLSHSF